jgi:hypothetical protein
MEKVTKGWTKVRVAFSLFCLVLGILYGEFGSSRILLQNLNPVSMNNGRRIKTSKCDNISMLKMRLNR